MGLRGVSQGKHAVPPGRRSGLRAAAGRRVGRVRGADTGVLIRTMQANEPNVEGRGPAGFADGAIGRGADRPLYRTSDGRTEGGR